jgi:hypothetical protein
MFTVRGVGCRCGRWWRGVVVRRVRGSWGVVAPRRCWWVAVVVDPRRRWQGVVMSRCRC